MITMRPALAALTVITLLSAALPACKKDEPPAPAAASTPDGAAQAGSPLVMPSTPPGRTPVPPHVNPARNVKGQLIKPLRPNLAKLRPFAPLRTTKIGKGTMSLDLEGLGPQSLPMNVYRRGRLVILSSDRADLGIVLALPTLAPGRYARGAQEGAAAKLPQPNLRARIGAAHQGLHLQAAAQDPAAFVAVNVLAGQQGAASGTFEGVVSQHGGHKRRKLTAGRFDLQVDGKIPGVAEVFSLDHALKTSPPAPAK